MREREKKGGERERRGREGVKKSGEEERGVIEGEKEGANCFTVVIVGVFLLGTWPTRVF